MTSHRDHTPKSALCQCGLSLIEVVISTVLVSLVIAGGMMSVGSMIHGHETAENNARADYLAQQLMTEILNVEYLDPDALIVLFGLELSEVTAVNGPRSAWNDVDDYHGWSSTPPQTWDGSSLPNLAGWERSVAVAWVDPADPQTVILFDQGVKRVTVTVRRNGVILSTLVSLYCENYTNP